MAQIRAFQVPGIKMWIPSGDHMPPHIHIRKPGEWKAKIRIMDAVIYDLRPADATIKASDRVRILEGVRNHRIELLEEWEACQAG
jgi:hypothetical protein